MHATRPAVFFDRDGTLIEDVPYLADPAQRAPAPRRGRGAAAAAAGRVGRASSSPTSRPSAAACITRGTATTTIHDELIAPARRGGAALDGIYYLSARAARPDKTLIEHPDRKPGPGMLLRAAPRLEPRPGAFVDHRRSAQRHARRARTPAAAAACSCAPGTTSRRPGARADWPVADDVLAAVRRDPSIRPRLAAYAASALHRTGCADAVAANQRAQRHGRAVQVRHRDAVVALDVEALAAVGDRAHQDRLPRPVVVARVALRRLPAVVVVERRSGRRRRS